ncbi:MAG: M23 family metallopeptidase [Anaerosomatales bacterium]|nr:M23 family metallopeptidase [Anaerosomatales bacterium]
MRRAAFFVAVALAAWSLEGISWGLDALGSPVPGAVLVRFGERYGSDRPRTHCGLDLAGTPGEPVRAPCDGEVVFAGLIPADGGGRVVAVTIQPEEGLAVTVSPLEASVVRKGDAVQRGATIGALAPSGDASSAQPHVHLSVRRDGRYVDPEPMLSCGWRTDVAGPERGDASPVSPCPRSQAVQETGERLPDARLCGVAEQGISVAAAHPAGLLARRRASDGEAAPPPLGADVADVRAAHWRALKARAVIERATGGWTAVDSETPSRAGLRLRPECPFGSGAVGAAAAGAVFMAATVLRRRAPACA